MEAGKRSYLGETGSAALWFALFGAAAVWFLAQSIGYFVVPWACGRNSNLPLHLIALVALAISLFAGYTGYRIWSDTGGRFSGDAPDPEDRSRFLAEIGVMASGLFGLILLAQWLAIIILGPCIPLPRIRFTPDALQAPSDLLLAHVGLPLAPHDLWAAWSSDPFIVLPLLWLAVFYGSGLRFGPRRFRMRALAFAVGWITLVIALLSPLHAVSDVLFSAHMAQHTLLVAVAAPLLVYGRPILVSLWALPRRQRRYLAQHRLSRVLARSGKLTPGQAFILHGALLWVWHAPVLYQAALGSSIVHAVQHAMFLLSALLFWGALFDVTRRSYSYGVGVLYVFATAVHTGLLGALIALAPQGWYPQYTQTTQSWGLTPLQDQQLAGMIMWVPAGMLYTGVALALLAAWLRESEGRVRVPRLSTMAVVGLLTLTAACDWPGGTLKAMDRASAATITGGNPGRGKRTIEGMGCGGCHTIRGVAAGNGLVGPPLNGIGKRLYIAGVLPNTPENMARWIHDPQAVDSLTVMPTLGVTMAQARDIAAYLYTLD